MGGTILVLPKSSSVMKSSSNGGGIFDYIWLLLTPLTILWGLLTSFVTPSPARPSNNSREQSGPGAQASNQRMKGDSRSLRSNDNIARLRNLSDDDDENNTWNGNSTQQ